MNTEERLARLEHELFRAHAVNDIQNLMGRYTVNHAPATVGQAINFFALDLPDVSAEIGDRGVYVGEAGLRELFVDSFPMEPVGNLLIHFIATPMVQVAADGKTARGVWRSPGVEAVRPADGGGPVALWSFGAYAADFVYISGTWKIHHLQWFRTIKSTFADGWVKDLSMTHGGPIKESPNVRPSTFHNPYTPESVQVPVPPCPPAYETYEGFGWATTAQTVTAATR
ncbi:nuclear transport factor 2 family protein [Sinomonas sp. ASV486]|uniref:nuclear transport factor 2 family protein n=1 Tax=Sinomonas sp. ASV486 TaxID=3051170 RepID=UPI0027DC283D|nr:nuclear transport factor 2 family protein [Sinomonas sp. ASV486]MDQ4489799.1 nuclear transport factor 2 family protein [Sinomonas sp. ASV486]